MESSRRPLVPPTEDDVADRGAMLGSYKDAVASSMDSSQQVRAWTEQPGEGGGGWGQADLPSHRFAGRLHRPSPPVIVSLLWGGQGRPFLPPTRSCCPRGRSGVGPPLEAKHMPGLWWRPGFASGQLQKLVIARLQNASPPHARVLRTLSSPLYVRLQQNRSCQTGCSAWSWSCLLSRPLLGHMACVASPFALPLSLFTVSSSSKLNLLGLTLTQTTSCAALLYICRTAAQRFCCQVITTL